jgi:hypothetical protein
MPVNKVIEVASKLTGINEHHIATNGIKFNSDIKELRL